MKDFDFITEGKRFYHLAKTLNFSVIKDPQAQAVVRTLYDMIQILKELVDNERRSLNRGNNG